jgi:hypothetical protein
MAAIAVETRCQKTVNKIHHKFGVHFVGYLYIMYLINARTMERIEMLTVV